MFLCAWDHLKCVRIFLFPLVSSWLEKQDRYKIIYTCVLIFNVNYIFTCKSYHALFSLTFLPAYHLLKPIGLIWSTAGVKRITWYQTRDPFSREPSHPWQTHTVLFSLQWDLNEKKMKDLSLHLGSSSVVRISEPLLSIILRKADWVLCWQKQTHKKMTTSFRVVMVNISLIFHIRVISHEISFIVFK